MKGKARCMGITIPHLGLVPGPLLYVTDHLHSSDSSAFIDSLDAALHEAFYLPPYISSDEAASLDAALNVGLY